MTEIGRPTPQTREDTPKFRFSYLFLFLDYILRWILLGLWRLKLLSSVLFWISQLIIIPVLIITLMGLRNSKIKTRYNSPNFDRINPETSAGPVLVCLLILSSGIYVGLLLVSELQGWKHVSAILGIIVGYAFYISLIIVSSYQTRSTEDLRKQSEILQERIAADYKEPVDANDIRIVGMETEISSVSLRVESYTLESVLFGALAFSGFLTLVASDKPVVADVKGLLVRVSDSINQIILFGFSRLAESLRFNLSDENLMAVVTLLTLVSSISFLSVIVSRLRFYGVLEQVDYAVRKARAFNDKEETVYNLKLEFEAGVGSKELINARLTELTSKVVEAIDNAQPLFRDLSSISNYIRIFRTLGLGSFLLVLVTSASLLSIKLGLLFIFLSVIASIYSTLNKLIRVRGWNKMRSSGDQRNGSTGYLTSRIGKIKLVS